MCVVMVVCISLVKQGRVNGICSIVSSWHESRAFRVDECYFLDGALRTSCSRIVFSWSLNRKVVLGEWWRIGEGVGIAHGILWCGNLRTFIVKRI